MTTNQEKITALEREIDELQDERRAAVGDERRDERRPLLIAITESRKTINLLLQQQPQGE